MNPAQREAHNRLQASLPKRTHLRIDPASRPKVLYNRRSNIIPVIVRGRKFESMLAACRHYHITQTTFYDWLKNGKARQLNALSLRKA